MTRFARRLVAYVVALAFVPMAAVTVAVPGVSSAECDRNVTTHCVTSSAQCDPNWSRNVWTNECKPPPPVPEWWTPRPAYAPPFAPEWIPPPPPAPPWQPGDVPVWNGGIQQWVFIGH